MLSTWINGSVFTAVLRYIVTGAAAYFTTRGYLSGDEAATLTPAIIGLGTVIWGIASARFKHVAVQVAGGKQAVKDAMATINPTGL